MGIYSNGTIFGITIYNFNDDHSNILFKRKYNELMNDEQKKEAYLFYNGLNDKNNIFFKIYTECSSTLNIRDTATFMTWYRISLEEFLQLFNV